MYDDFDDSEAEHLDQIIDVHEDCVTVRLPDLNAFVMTDNELNYLFNHPEKLGEIVEDYETIKFLSALIPNILRVRNLKREIYTNLGFSS
jgi:hypothetical protein